MHSVIPLIEEKNFAQAGDRLRQGLKQFPRSALLANALGMVDEQQGRDAEAAREYRQALDWLPSFTAARIHLAAVDARSGNCAEAAELFNTAANQVKDPGALAAIGVGLTECADYAGAARVLSWARGLAPASPALTWNLALAEFKAGMPEQALAALDELTTGAESERPAALYLRGCILRELKRPGAGEMLAHACSLHAEEDYCNDAATALLGEDRARDAVDLLQRVFKSLPPTAGMLSTLGLAQFRLGRYTDAIDSYQRASRLDPAFVAPREGLGFLLYLTGDLQRASAVVREALQAADKNFSLPYLDALILWRISHQLAAQALASAEISIARNPRFAPAYFLRGKIRMDTGKPDAALADFQTAARLDPKYALPWFRMAQIYYREGRTDDARAAEQRFAVLGSMREDEDLARQAQSILAAYGR